MTTIILRKTANNLFTAGNLARLLDKWKVKHLSNGFLDRVEMVCEKELPAKLVKEIGEMKYAKDISYENLEVKSPNTLKTKI